MAPQCSPSPHSPSLASGGGGGGSGEELQLFAAGGSVGVAATRLPPSARHFASSELRIGLSSGTALFRTLGTNPLTSNPLHFALQGEAAVRSHRHRHSAPGPSQLHSIARPACVGVRLRLMRVERVHRHRLRLSSWRRR
eukprot:COSAG01_NODE_18237_length_1090_cov_2.964682_2_plen_139_part_00